MSSLEVTVWVLPLSGGWQPLGAGQGVEVMPASVSWEKTMVGGPSGASFSLARHTRTPYSDLGPFTPVAIQCGGVFVWSGRVMRTPKLRGDGTTWDVECEGWYSHLQDDLYDHVFVSNSIAPFVDTRNFRSVSTAVYGATGECTENAFGSLLIRFQTGNTIPLGHRTGFTYDVGPDNTIEKAVIVWDGSAGFGSGTVNIRGTDDSSAAGGETVSFGAVSTVGPTTSTFEFAQPRRFVHIYYERTGATTVLTVDRSIRFRQTILFSSAAFESGGGSILKASDIVADVLSTKCPLISADQSQIGASATSLPHYSPLEYKTPRDIVESVLLYDESQFTLLPEPVPVARLRTIPSRAVWVYDASQDAGMFEDGGANDGEEMYNRAIVSYSATDGTSRADLVSTTASAIAFTNGTFDAGVTSWSAGTNTSIAQATSNAHDGAGSLRLTATGGTGSTVLASSSAFSASFQSGRTYTVTCWVRAFSASAKTAYIYDDVSGETASVTDLVVGTWYPLSHTFVATGASHTITVQFASAKFSTLPAAVIGFADTFTVELQGETLIDRRGFLRTIELSGDVSTTAASATLGAAYLAQGELPPFKGALTISGHVRKHGTNEVVPVAWLADGDVLLVADETDPATGGFGRSGVIARVSYDHDTCEAQIDLDSRRDIIDELVRGQSD